MPPKNPKLEKAKREKAKKEAAKKIEDEAAANASKLPSMKAEGGESAEDALRRQGVIVTYTENRTRLDPNSRDIQVENLTMNYHGSPLIEESDLTLNYGNRYGFIGRNGCGKSTFMNVIASRCIPIPEGIDIYHVKEEIEATEMSALEAVMSVDEEKNKLETEAELLNDIIAVDPDNSEAMNRLNTIYERLDGMDASTAETRASKILSGLGFTPFKQAQPTKSFSGGWRMRVALARALFIQPTLLLLDEPTNHLDMEAVVWLEDYLSKWDKILFMVSHSQDFMNTVCTHMVHFTQKRLDYFTGNYDSFVNTLEEKNGEQEKRYKQEQDQIQHMKDYVAKFGQGNSKMAKQAQSKEKVLGKMLKSGLTEKVSKERALDFKFTDPGKLTPPVLQCTDIAFGYPGCEILYSGVDFGVDLDSRVALVGPNGAGKSTLLKIMTGELAPVRGNVRPHAHLRISKFNQHFNDVLDLSMCPLDYFISLWPDQMTREDGRKWLGRYGISGPVQTQVMEQLSDGQKSRVVLAKMARENPHMLFLDEPTNHLDMESIDSLAKAINAFGGGMMLVSHDMRLISQVAKEIWMCDNKTVTKFVGEIADFKLHLRQEMAKSGLIEGGTSKKDIPASKPRFVPLAPLKTFGDQGPDLKVAPPAAPTKEDNGEEDMVRNARLELAELAIKKQRARQQKETEKEDTAVELTDEQMEKEAARQEKIAAKKAEKEAAAVWAKEQEELIERRRIEKEETIREGKIAAEERAKEFAEWKAKQDAKEAKEKAVKDAEQARVAALIAEKRAEKEARRLAREKRRIEEEAARAAAAEAKARADPWTQAQQNAFETALLEYTIAYDKEERWAGVAAAVEEKTRNQCIARYKFIKDILKQKQMIANAV